MDRIASMLHLTEKMLEASRSGEWDLLAALQEQREQLLHATETQAGFPVEPELALATLRKVLVLNEEITSIARAERQEREAQLKGLRRSRRGASCYMREAQSLPELHRARQR